MSAKPGDSLHRVDVLRTLESGAHSVHCDVGCKLGPSGRPFRHVLDRLAVTRPQQGLEADRVGVTTVLGGVSPNRLRTLPYPVGVTTSDPSVGELADARQYAFRVSAHPLGNRP